MACAPDANHDVRTGSARKEPWDLGHWRLAVCCGEEDPLAAPGAKRRAHRAAEPAVRRVMLDADFRIARAELVGEPARAIGAAVVHDQDLAAAEMVRGDDGPCFADDAFEAPDLVVRRERDCQTHGPTLRLRRSRQRGYGDTASEASAQAPRRPRVHHGEVRRSWLAGSIPPDASATFSR